MIKKHIYIIACGGTIAGKAASPEDLTGYTAGEATIDELLAAVPEIAQYADVQGEQFCNIDSSNMSEALWLALAKRRWRRWYCHYSRNGFFGRNGVFFAFDCAYSQADCDGWLYAAIDGCQCRWPTEFAGSGTGSDGTCTGASRRRRGHEWRHTQCAVCRKNGYNTCRHV